MKNNRLALIAVAICLSLTTSFSYASVYKPKPSIHSTKNLSVAELSGNIEYGFSKSSIRSVYYNKLDQLARYLIDNNAALTLRGYADSIGSFKGNWKLSEKRAVVVKGYLVKKGVGDEKIITTAFGSTQPLTTNQTALGRQKNRRVEIKVSAVNP